MVQMVVGWPCQATRSLGMIGLNKEEFPVERLYVNSNGEITSITHDIRAKFWNVTYLEELDYNKQKKPVILLRT